MKRITIRIACALLGVTLSAAHIRVSPSGLNSNHGSADKPVALLAAAQRKARAYSGGAASLSALFFLARFAPQGTSRSR